MNYIVVHDDLKVDCAAQFLSDNALTWWETMKERRASKVLT